MYVANQQLDWTHAPPTPNTIVSIGDITTATQADVTTHEMCHVKVWQAVADNINDFYASNVGAIKTKVHATKGDAIDNCESNKS